MVENSDRTFNLLRGSLLQLSTLAQTLYGYKEQKATVSGCVKSVYHDTVQIFKDFHWLNRKLHYSSLSNIIVASVNANSTG